MSLRKWLPLFLAAFALPVFASGSHETASQFLWLTMLLLFARLSGLVERLGLPAVLGELAAGMLLGNVVLVGLPSLSFIAGDRVLQFLGELGLVILLFQVGLESDLKAMRAVGLRAFSVASVGVVLPFLIGAALVGPWLLPGASTISYLFLGAALTATSVGITGRVFKDAGMLSSQEARIVLGSAVIDDILGLIILAVVSALAIKGSVDIAQIGLLSAKAFAILAVFFMIGQWFAPRVSALMARVHGGASMQFTVIMAFCLGFSWLADLAGLAAIVGAFAAGLVLDAAVVKPFEAAESNEAAKHRMMHMVEPLGFLLGPLFFVLTGMQVDLHVFADVQTLLVTLGLTLAALLGKVAAGAVAGSGVNRWLIGWGMAPRGEVGLIFASIGLSLGVLTPAIYSVVVGVMVLTTLVTPPVLSVLIRRMQRV
ncbi:cation:proton antiporter [Burkholderiaceae bacterium DAT-1]|nr:cation:proton antiporter [Burkholderiaceae bacterium DAT-1]